MIALSLWLVRYWHFSRHLSVNLTVEKRGCMEATIDLNENEKHSTWLPMILAGAMFFILGCITWLNGAITPFLQQMLEGRLVIFYENK